MAKLTGVLKNEDKPFSGSLIMTALNRSIEQYKWRIADAESVDFDKIEIEPLA